MKKLGWIVIVSLVAGLWLMPAPRVNAQTELERVEKEIRGLEALAGLCVGQLSLIMPPGPNPLPEDKAAYEKQIKAAEECAAKIQQRLEWLRKKLGELISKLPSTTGPPEDPKRKKRREQIEDWEKRMAAAEEKKNQIRQRLEELLKTTKSNQPAPGFKAENTSTGGVSTTTFNTPQGRILVYLPADMRAGDVISGTVVTEPNGQTEDERARNLASLNSYQLKIANETLSAPWGTFRWTWTKPTPKGAAAEGQPTTALPETQLIDLIAPISNEKGSGPVARQNISEGPSVVSPNKIELPALGQNGRPVQIRGPFDGNSTSTDIKIGGQPATVIAESPRSCIFKSPETNFGLNEITVKEDNVETKGPYRNLGVRLSAPKTNLLKGESTTVTITVEGLKGIQQNVPLLLEKKGDVSMEGGDVQTIQIRPNDVVILGSEVRADVRKVVIGLRPGFFNITATVIDPRLRPIIIPLFENGGVNGYRVKKDGTGFVINVENVKHPITGDPVDGQHKLEHKCPDLKKLPYIQSLFLNKGVGRGKSECLIMMTPHIIVSDEN